jgi:hypothetical protein
MNNTLKEIPEVPNDPLLGAGSGGDPPAAPQSVMVFKSETHEGGWGLGAQMLSLTANNDDPKWPPVVSIFAGDWSDNPNSRVEAHATQGVRISCGPPRMPPASNPSITGIEIQTGDKQLLKITRGFTEASSQKIWLYPDSIQIDAGSAAYGVSITSATMISLSVGENSSILLTPAGVTIKGLLTKIN